MKPSIAIHLSDVVFRYVETGKRNILDHVSLDIEEGGITVLMGSSGCGKSTLAAVLAGLYPENGGFLESGTIELYGHPVSTMNQQERAAYLTMLFQNPDLQFCMDTLRREMQFCMENICVPKEEMDRRIGDAARILGMETLLDRKLVTLSGGEKQKAAICCLYVMESKCILLDEAFANIDSQSVTELVSLLLKLKQLGRTIVAIDHQLGHWADAADEIIVLGEGGKVLQRGIRPEQLEEFYSLFEREGLYYPGRTAAGRDFMAGASALSTEPDISGTGCTRSGSAKVSASAITFRDVSIARTSDARGSSRNTSDTLHTPGGHASHFRLFRKNKGDDRGAAGSKGDLSGAQSEQYLLSHVDADFPKGAMTAVLGPSGSGKTTTFLSVLKQHPYEGHILIDGMDLSQIKKKELFARAGIVFQNPGNQFITQNVTEEVKSSTRIWNEDLTDEQCEKQAFALLKEYGLERYHRYSPYMLSQGQQRRLAVLSILAGRQQILFLDEPTYGQDYRSTMAIMEQLSRKVKEDGLTVIFITHDQELAAVWADKIYCLQGQKFNEMMPDLIFADNAHPMGKRVFINPMTNKSGNVISDENGPESREGRRTP
ncbi:MAG: ATP-binding cassette domain-containing protein [Lachnospiraceae bacterium]|nr:ATP-binding cassette domain-containing protein [Lachnospiraceae bacterium]